MCASDQDRYEDYQQRVVVQEGKLDSVGLERIAEQAGLKLDVFRECAESHVKQRLVEEDVQEAQQNGLEGSPVFAVNGVRLSGARPAARIRMLVEIELRGAPTR